ncbi:hypothetical protein EYF80_063391 [Liparis tanakae]|uniref:Uncharacterized protein n=1 Tax=Liparis tanakae TaxID=230148 RepID=A0A4Z2ECK5_9TELE|nr:hypothetical protein EYF80_063391 [Liparis tanakae]
MEEVTWGSQFSGGPKDLRCPFQSVPSRRTLTRCRALAFVLLLLAPGRPAAPQSVSVTHDPVSQSQRGTAEPHCCH